jgi:hypothetical protein
MMRDTRDVETLIRIALTKKRYMNHIKNLSAYLCVPLMRLCGEQAFYRRGAEERRGTQR